MKFTSGCGEMTGKSVKLNKSLCCFKDASHEFHKLLAVKPLDYVLASVSPTPSFSG